MLLKNKIELDGGGQRLGYRNMNLKLRTEHNICVPRKLVSDAMSDLDCDGVKGRKVWKKAKPPKSVLYQMAQAGYFH